MMGESRVIKRLGDILIFDKRFNGIPRERQMTIAHFNHVSAEELKSLKLESGDVRLISTGLFDGYTTEEKAGLNLNRGEIITIPTGGVANIKYYNGAFVDSGNLIGVAGDDSICLKYVFYGMTFKRDIINSFYRGVSIKHPYMPDICNIELPIPSFREQQAIASELDCLTSVLDKRKQQLIELDLLSQSVFSDMFGEDNEVLRRWPTSRLEEICSKIVDCPHSTPQKEKGPTKYPCIRTSELKGGSISWDSMQYVSKQEYESRIARLTPKAGDIVYGREGSFGDAVILPEGYFFCLGQRTMLFRANPECVNNVFLHRVLISPIIFKQAKDNSVTSTVSHINVKDIKRFLIPVPPKDKQLQFARKIEAIEKQKELIRRSIDETSSLFNCRMSHWFN